jgi:hypothetical protein
MVPLLVHKVSDAAPSAGETPIGPCSQYCQDSFDPDLRLSLAMDTMEEIRALFRAPFSGALDRQLHTN